MSIGDKTRRAVGDLPNEDVLEDAFDRMDTAHEAARLTREARELERALRETDPNFAADVGQQAEEMEDIASWEKFAAAVILPLMVEHGCSVVEAVAIWRARAREDDDQS
jgi:hypothetical protein